MDLKYQREGTCNKCGLCCHELKIKIDYRIGGELVEYYTARGIDVKLGMKWTILTLPNYPCPHLKGDNTCNLQQSGRKPLVCYLFPEKQWQIPEGCAYKLIPIK